MFIILMLIFVLQAVWLYISELAGKDLDVIVIAKFLIYLTPTLIPLILPLTVLLSSIMVFGNFAENYEFAAMKSTGISLQRAMRSLSVFIILLGILTFFFSNNVIPWAQYNSYNLRKNIAKIQPAMAIAEGQFNDVGTFNIKVAEKSGERGQYLKDVVIHKKPSSGIGNNTVIMSKTGELISSEESNIIKLVLKDGWYYEDVTKKDFKDRQKRPFAKSEFKKYVINIDINQADVDLDEKQITSKYDMLDITHLDYTIDSLVGKKANKYKEFASNIYNRSNIKTINENLTFKKKDTTFTDTIFKGNIVDLFPARNKNSLLDQAINMINSNRQIVSSTDDQITRDNSWLNKHVFAFHEKFTLGLACIILFFVGAPLGALIKKGGIGLPMVIAILLFLTYHFMGIFAKNSGINDKIDIVFSAWLPTIIMLPLSIYLTRAATQDRPLVSFDFFENPIKKLLAIKEDKKLEQELLDESSNEYNQLVIHNNEKLIDIVKNYHQYDFNLSFRNSALKILEDRGITSEELKFSGNLTNQTYEDANREMKLYKENSRVAVASYIIYAVFLVLGLVFNNNGFPTLSIISFALFGVAFLSFASYISKSFYNASNFYKTFDNNSSVNFLALAFVLIGIPLYFVVHLYFCKKMKEDINQIS